MVRDEAYRRAEQKIEEALRSGATELDLSAGWDVPYKKLTELPESIGQLTRLQSLYLNDNQLMVLPESLGNLTQLRELSLSGNQLKALPESLGNLTQLRVLGLAENDLTVLPESISDLIQLRELYLYGNQLGQLPESIGDLTYLGVLDLSFNQLSDIPSSLAQRDLLQLDLSGNPLNPEIEAAYEQGFDAVSAFLRAKATAKITLNEAKLILVGEGEVGKSCLLGALRDDPFVEGLPTTHGIEIKPVNVTDPESGTEITLNGWDFGGQRVYRPTHQLFFSSPAVYLVHNGISKSTV